jgi:enoyl-CoA hydratase
MSDKPSIEVSEPEDGVVQLTIRRPERLNALREVEHDALFSVWRDFESRPEVRAVVVTGEGSFFSAGGDLDFVRDVTTDDTVRANAWWAARAIVREILECRKPVVSAVEGGCVGAGTTVALMADICIAAEDARIIDGHLAFGASPGDHAAFLWPLAIGINRARGKLLLNEPITGAEAAELGLVYESVPAGGARARAWEIARKLASYDPFAVTATKMSVNGLLRQNWQVFESSLALEFMCFTNSATRDAVDREVERRNRSAQRRTATEDG